MTVRSEFGRAFRGSLRQGASVAAARLGIVRVTRAIGARHRARWSGQGLVEFSLVIPIFVVMLFGIVDFGRVIWARNSLENAAREGARYAIVHGGSASQTCPVGPPSSLLRLPPEDTVSCPVYSPEIQPIKDAALRFAFAPGSGVSADVCYHTAGTTCTGHTNNPLTITNLRGTAVTVRVTSTLNLIVPSLLHLGSFTVTGESTMLINY